MKDPPKPVDCDARPFAPPKGAPVALGDSENIVARKGFAAPAAPVICGRRPTPGVLPAKLDPSPVGCEFRKELLPSDGDGVCFDCWLMSGVVGWDWGIGGSDSRSCAPNDDDGLNGLIPENPVVCGCRALVFEVVVAPVGWLDSDEKTELVKLEPVGDVVEPKLSEGGGDVLVPGLLLLFPRVNDEATLEMIELFWLGLNPVCCGCNDVGDVDPFDGDCWG